MFAVRAEGQGFTRGFGSAAVGRGSTALGCAGRSDVLLGASIHSNGGLGSGCF